MSDLFIMRGLTSIRRGLSICKIVVQVVLTYSRDCIRFLKNSRTLGLKSQAQYEAAIIAHYHVLEKGLTMPSRKKCFGRDIAFSLYDLLIAYLDGKSFPPNVQIKAAIQVLHEYSLVTGICFPLLASWLDGGLGGEGGGIRVKRETFLEKSVGSFPDLVSIRRSVRNYDNRKIDISLIAMAVSLAQQSPSVCNRQSTRVFYYQNRNMIDSILALQNGNRGFGDLANGLFIVASDMSVFSGAGERTQAWVDSGLFVMTLLYSLSYLGLGACPLNWCVNYEADKSLRRLTGMADHLVIIMLISVGHLPSEFDLAVSQRRKIDDVLACIK
jgi:nitroreductase